MWLQLLQLANLSFPSVFNNGIIVELLWKLKLRSFQIDRNIYLGWKNTAKMIRLVTQIFTYMSCGLSPSMIFPFHGWIFIPSLWINLPQKWNMRLALSGGTSAATVYEMWIERLFCCVTFSRLCLPLWWKALLSTLYQPVNSQRGRKKRVRKGKNKPNTHTQTKYTYTQTQYTYTQTKTNQPTKCTPPNYFQEVERAGDISLVGTWNISIPP